MALRDYHNDMATDVLNAERQHCECEANVGIMESAVPTLMRGAKLEMLL